MAFSCPVTGDTPPVSLCDPGMRHGLEPPPRHCPLNRGRRAVGRPVPRLPAGCPEKAPCAGVPPEQGRARRFSFTDVPTRAGRLLPPALVAAFSVAATVGGRGRRGRCSGYLPRPRPREGCRPPTPTPLPPPCPPQHTEGPPSEVGRHQPFQAGAWRLGENLKRLKVGWGRWPSPGAGPVGSASDRGFQQERDQARKTRPPPPAVRLPTARPACDQGKTPATLMQLGQCYFSNAASSLGLDL